MKIHCIAIGERILCHLALALAHKGYTVTGSDIVINTPFKNGLAAKGLLPKVLGWYPEKIHNTLNAVLIGVHAQPDNPELLRAQELGLKVYTCPEFLYEQSKYKTRVVIGGSYGKAAITAMILHVLRYHNIPVDYSIETPSEGIEYMVHLTEENDFMIFEGDEYPITLKDKRPKFHQYHPNIALLSDMVWKPTEVFSTFEVYREAFQTFVEGIVKGGSITYNDEDAEVKKVVEGSKNTIRKLPYCTPHHRIKDGIPLLDTLEGEMPLEIFGTHHLNNLAGARWICQHVGVDETDFYEAIALFTGT